MPIAASWDQHRERQPRKQNRPGCGACFRHCYVKRNTFRAISFEHHIKGTGAMIVASLPVAPANHVGTLFDCLSLNTDHIRIITVGEWQLHDRFQVFLARRDELAKRHLAIWIRASNARSRALPKRASEPFLLSTELANALQRSRAVGPQMRCGALCRRI